MRAIPATLLTLGGLLVCVSLASAYFPHAFGPPRLMGNLFELGLWVLALVLLFLARKKRNRPAHSVTNVEVQIETQKPKLKHPAARRWPSARTSASSRKIPLS